MTCWRRWTAMRAIGFVALLTAAALSGCASVEDTAGFVADPFQDTNGDDAVVIAVIDSGINPYHFDYAARFMPQQRNNDASDDLPLDTDPSTWLPGYPAVEELASYQALPLTLSTDEGADGNTLKSDDGGLWDTVLQSAGEDNAGIHLNWIPGTKIVGLVTFSGDGFGAGTHGGGSASVSTGNFHGACPECLLVFVNGLGHEANEWVAKQDWIDAQTNSWGYSTGLVVRDRIHTGCDLGDQHNAVERGQQIFFSGGNGIGNAFTVPNPTLFSCQEGPDWIVTVGAVSEVDGSSKHSGTPADVASIGGGYGSAYCSTNINCTGSFGGTSNATPVTTGMYGKALWEVRRMMEGPTRMQSNGIIAAGIVEGAAADGPLGDGVLTVHELRQALYDASTWQAVGRSVIAGPSAPVLTDETVWAAEGHGTFIGRLHGDKQYHAEIDRIVAMATGAETRDYPADAINFFASLSQCTQDAWGAWEHGEANRGTSMPATDKPMTAWFQTACAPTVKAVIDVA
jgi:hypothetical protein